MHFGNEPQFSDAGYPSRNGINSPHWQWQRLRAGIASAGWSGSAVGSRTGPTASTGGFTARS